MSQIEQFDTNEECRCLCIEKIFRVFDLEMDTPNQIRKINNFIKTYKYLQERGLQVQGYIDKRLLLNPKYCFYLIKRDISSNKKFFDEENENVVYLYYTSSKELYGIDDIWTHCVCEIYNKGVREIYDSYWNQIQRDYVDINFPSREVLSNKLIIALKIWRKKDENCILRV